MVVKSASERARSPRAPRHSLRDAVRYARAIYNGVHRSPIDSHIAYKLMGLRKSGASAHRVSSVRQFGLIEGWGTGQESRILR